VPYLFSILQTNYWPDIYPKKIAYFIVGFFFIIYSSIYGQDKSTIDIDSLSQIYKSGIYKKQDKLKILKELAVNHTDPEKILQYSEELIEAARGLDSIDYLFQGYLEKGNALRFKSNLSHALQSYFQGAQIVEDEESKIKLGKVYIAIADVYSIMGNHQNAVNYYRKAINILRQENDSSTVASALLNAGDEYTNHDKLDSAQIYTEEAEAIFKKLDSQLGQAYSLGNLGMIYAKLGRDLKAEYHMNRAILILEELNEYYPIAVYLIYISDIYLEKGDGSTALNYANRSLKLAQKYGLKKQVSDAYLALSRIYEQAGNTEESFNYYKNHITYKDSVNDISTVQQMADLRTNFEVSRKQMEVDLLNEQKKNQQTIVIATIIALILICLLAIGLYNRFLYIRKTSRIIEKERKRSDNLLLNILPRDTAQELKQNGKVIAKRFESVSVLFTDFKGFTEVAEHLPPEKLVETIDFYFSKFDAIIEKHNLEKIKTVGDAYMCAGGLPFPSEDHAVRIVKAGIEILELVRGTQQLKSAEMAQLDVRIGINTGPVVAGVVGTKKFAYDIWGDTVNIASRMESNSEPGKINISESTYNAVKDAFDCEYRGEIKVKNRGILKMYFVNEEVKVVQ
jgi:class 3 adenylate cyclase/Tfp pilus assembly protein PilF